MTDAEIAEDIQKMKDDIQSLRLMVRVLMSGDAIQNKRIDAVDSLAGVSGKLASLATDLITEHLDALKKIVLLEPARSALPEPPKKTESHPEFG